MMLSDELLKHLWNLIRKLIKPVFKFLTFTGLWLWVIYLFLTKSLFPTIEVSAVRETIYRILFIGYAVYKTLQSTIRLVTKDGSFKLIKTILPKRSKIPNPNIKELQSKELNGFIFGKRNGHIIHMPETDNGHILIVGGAGSGKSSCIAIPSLLTWRERVFAIDIKKELSEKSSKSRFNTKIFNPEDKDTIGYNPFYLLDFQSENRVQDAKDISFALIPLPPETKEPFWINSARDLLTGAILYFSGNGASFIDTMTQILSQPITELVKMIYEGNDQEAKLFITQFIDINIKTLGGIFTELSNHIMIFATDKQLKNALSRERFITPNDLENGFDIFVCIPEHKLEQWKDLLTLLCTQFLKHFERREEKENNAPILFMLDEFPRLGKIEPILTALATLRSKKIHVCLIVQSLAQLDSIYGKDNRRVIMDNCSYKAILKATDGDTQEYLSKLIGTYDKEKKTQSAQFEQYTSLGKGTGMSKTTEEKRIVKPEEFAYMEDIILLSPKGYTRIEKTPYYKDKLFVGKV